jgi:hypothetical protein
VIPETTRKSVRDGAEELRDAIERRSRVTRPDGTDEKGHPGIAAANLAAYLGNYTVPFLDEIERLEAVVEALSDRIDPAILRA